LFEETKYLFIEMKNGMTEMKWLAGESGWELAEMK
jgi:hypothetical protein